MKHSVVVLALAGTLLPALCLGQGDRQPGSGDLPSYLRDRGAGIASSMFGTYIEEGEFLFYPFYEFYLDDDAEYAPGDFGYPGDETYAGVTGRTRV